MHLLSRELDWKWNIWNSKTGAGMDAGTTCDHTSPAKAIFAGTKSSGVWVVRSCQGVSTHWQQMPLLLNMGHTQWIWHCRNCPNEASLEICFQDELWKWLSQILRGLFPVLPISLTWFKARLSPSLGGRKSSALAWMLSYSTTLFFFPQALFASSTGYLPRESMWGSWFP